MAKSRPQWVSKAAPDPSPVEGVDNLPLPAGTNRWAVQQAEAASEATPMGPANADGDNPAIPDVAGFATGKDMRNRNGGPKSDPAPGMPGA